MNDSFDLRRFVDHELGLASRRRCRLKPRNI
jgi:hypothetical protein